MVGGRGGHFLHGSAQKGVGLQFQRHFGRQGRPAFFAQARGGGPALLERRVVRLDLQGPAQVRQGVFVRAAYQRVAWQRGEFAQRIQHLFRRPLEESPATGGKERVATKQEGGAF